MASKCHSHILQTNSWHRKEESKNDNGDTTVVTLQKQSNTVTNFPDLPQKTCPYSRTNIEPPSNLQTLIAISERRYFHIICFYGEHFV